MTAVDLRTELGRRVHGGVDLAAELLLRGRQRLDDGRKGQIADDEDVDVAGALELAASGRAEDQGNIDTLGQRSERRPHDLNETGGLRD